MSSYIVQDTSLVHKFNEGKGICTIFGVRKDLEDKQLCLPFSVEDFNRQIHQKKFNPLFPYVSTYIKIAFINDCFNCNENPRIERFIFKYKDKYSWIWNDWFILENNF